ncbi:MAG: DNA double-strand break repair nuclease NurA [Chloroflexi bacterium]|nr:DNA double-strand break repair nuclease NurA [Chloroflexota bacterium]
MALELNKLTSSVDALGASTAERLTKLEAALPTAQATLNAIAADPTKLEAQIAKAIKLRWIGALPTREPVNAVYPQPEPPSRYNFIAADGSQIYPDRHGLALYYLINVGSIIFQMGTGGAPVCNSQPQLFFDEQDLYYDGENFPITRERVDALRDVYEAGELARLVSGEAATAPTAAIIDGTLRLASNAREQNRAFIEEARTQYINHLSDIRASKAALAGVIDRSASNVVIRLLNLATLEPEAITQQEIDATDLFPGALDIDLFGKLKFGERSALFTTPAAEKDLYVAEGHRVYFFYLNAGQPPHDPPLRVEVPEWVVNNNQVDLVHTAIVEQSRHTSGYPYALTRAHELAVVTVQEHRAFDEMLVATLVRRGVAPTVSQKARGKAMLGKRR